VHHLMNRMAWLLVASLKERQAPPLPHHARRGRPAPLERQNVIETITIPADPPTPAFTITAHAPTAATWKRVFECFSPQEQDRLNDALERFNAGTLTDPADVLLCWRHAKAVVRVHAVGWSLAEPFRPERLSRYVPRQRNLVFGMYAAIFMASARKAVF